MIENTGRFFFTLALKFDSFFFLLNTDVSTIFISELPDFLKFYFHDLNITLDGSLHFMLTKESSVVHTHLHDIKFLLKRFFGNEHI